MLDVFEGNGLVKRVVQVVQTQGSHLSSHVRPHCEGVPLAYHMVENRGTQVVQGGTTPLVDDLLMSHAGCTPWYSGVDLVYEYWYTKLHAPYCDTIATGGPVSLTGCTARLDVVAYCCR